MKHSKRLLVLDVGTQKVAGVVLSMPSGGLPQVLGYGMAPSRGVDKGVVVNPPEVTRAVERVLARALRLAQVPREGMPVWSNLAATPVKTLTHRGVVGVTQGMVEEEDLRRAEEAAQAVPAEHNRFILHVLRRGYRLDEREVEYPLGMYGYRLEAEVYIITVPKTDVFNLRQCIEETGVQVEGLVLNALASGEAVLSAAEREMGVVVCDIGAGLTDVAIYAQGQVVHVDVIPRGGRHLTLDLSYVLSLPFTEAEQLKLQHGYAHPDAVPEEAEWLFIRPFGEGREVRIHPRDVAAILEARVREMLGQIHEVIAASGYEGRLPAGVVLTGGTAQLPGLRRLAMEYLKMPVRIGLPEVPARWPKPMTGPEFATLAGVARFARMMYETPSGIGFKASRRHKSGVWESIKGFLRSLLPAVLGTTGLPGFLWLLYPPMGENST